MRLKRYISDITTRISDITESDSELEQTFSDFIEMYIENRDKEKEAKYRRLYQEKFGREYQAHKEFIPKPSLDQVYSKKDFQRYQDYVKYCNDLYVLRFNKFGGLAVANMGNPYITWSKMEASLSKLGVTPKIGKPRGTEGAWVVNSKEIIFLQQYYDKDEISKELLIHELGHILDNRLNDPSAFSDLFLLNQKCTQYDLNPSEIFADSFLNYFVSPKYLRAGWKDVYEWFNKKVPGKWKTAIKILIRT